MEIVLKVEGMMCHNCEKHVEEAVKAVKGVKNVQADHEQKLVVVTVKDGSVDAIKAAIEGEGYTVLSHEEKPAEKKGLFSRFKK